MPCCDRVHYGIQGIVCILAMFLGRVPISGFAGLHECFERALLDTDATGHRRQIVCNVVGP